jgi:DNA-binding MarR family transcriptional regulator
MTTEQPEKLGLIFRRISNAIKKDIDGHMRDIDLTMSQCMVLDYLSKAPSGSVPQKDIEQHFSLQHPTVSGILKRLERNGFVKAATNKNDRRYKNIFLLDKAKAVSDSVAQHQKKIDGMFVRGLSKEEQETLRRLLQTVQRNVLDGSEDQKVSSAQDGPEQSK